MIGSDGEGKRKEAISPKEREPNRQQKVNCNGVRSTKRKKERRKGKQKKERERQRSNSTTPGIVQRSDHLQLQWRRHGVM